MPDVQCPSCDALVSDTAKFCPECGAPVIKPGTKPPGKKRVKAKMRKKRSRLSGMLLRLFEMIGRVIVNLLDWFLILALMPFLLIQLSHGIGTIAAWIAIALAVACAVMMIKPMPVPMGNTVRKAKVATAIMMVVAVPALFFGQQTDELRELRRTDIPAYLLKLRDYRGDEKWLTAIKEQAPNKYSAALIQIETEKADKANRKAEQVATEARQKAAKKAAEAKQKAAKETSRQRKKEQEERCGTDAKAYGLVMSAVERNLKNPDGADFVSSGLKVVMESCGVWLVMSAVDATNGFGATIRTYFSAKVTRSPDGRWEL